MSVATEHKVTGRVEKITLEAVVIRKDGTREDLGVIASYHRSRWRRFLNWLHGGGRVAAPEPEMLTRIGA
jgi:hypothetical protein